MENESNDVEVDAASADGRFAQPPAVTPPPIPDALSEGPPPGATAPVAAGERYETLDVVRGVAILGIFAMNITSFAYVAEAYFEPDLAGTDSPLDWFAWRLNHALFEQKMMTLFSMLFGAGVCLFAERALRKRGASAGLHYRRMGWLLFFGLLHAYLLWWGDILVPYALAGMVIYFARGLGWKALSAIGAGMLSLTFMLSVALGLLWAWKEANPPSDTTAAPSWRSEEIDAIAGGYVSRIVEFNAPSALEMHVFVLPFYLLPHVMAAMIFGMALYRSGFLTGELGAGAYKRALAFATPLAIVFVMLGAHFRVSSGFGYAEYFLYGSALDSLGALAAAVCYISIVALAVKAGALRRARTALAACGRLAFTNYIMQSVLGCLIFYKPGLYLHNELSRAELWLVVLGVWAFQIAFSLAYLRAFSMGPLEWLWRCGAYGRLVRRPRAAGG